jgi:ATPase subunit of ABC transporter with duplicated ATPase domains
VLQAQAISVEVGGRLLVDSASFTVMPRDKVGIVGRNGAGKTSLFKVLGGANEPKSGKVLRKGGFGYLPQDPKIDSALDGRSCVTHVLSGRGIDDEITRIEKLRIAMEENPDERNVTRYSDAEEAFRTTGGYAAESEARAMAAGLGIPDARLDQPISTLSGGERRRVELARILFAGSDVLCLDEPTNHLDVDAKAWLLGFLRQYKGALLVISHDLELLDESITRVLHLDRATETDVGEIVEYRGTYSQYQRARAEDEARLAKKAVLQAKEIDRLQTVVDRFGAKATKAAMAHSVEKRIARLESQRVRGPQSGKTMTVRFPDPPKCGENGHPRVGSVQGLRRPDDLRGHRLRPRAWRTPAGARPERRRQDQPVAHPRWRDRRRSRRLRVRLPGARRLLRPGARQPAHRPVVARPTSATPSPTASTSPRHSCAACSACSGCRARRSSRNPARCRAARRPSSRWPC